ncbi:MAG: His/Gly/Thr/Pro-type tRNA ligase C-terminal domain-containing protein, partial [Bacteroidales bacterium]|nr:His/Gly/Thr/Pro-type tRNA ligase C-terminal domain-containing protein [Bacteroidales bacterium]
PLLKELRANGIVAEIYTENVKLKKQFDYATKRGIPYIAIIGEEEMRNNCVNVKNLSSGEQIALDISGLSKWLKDNQE